MFSVKLTHKEVTVYGVIGSRHVEITEPRSANLESQVQRMKRQLEEDAKEATRLEAILNPAPAPEAKPVVQEEAPKPKNPIFRKS